MIRIQVTSNKKKNSEISFFELFITVRLLMIVVMFIDKKHLLWKGGSLDVNQ